MRYLGKVGAILGIAIVGTIVTSAITGELVHRLPTNEAEQRALAGALQQGFLAVFVFALLALAVSFFLKEMSITATRGALAPESTAQADEDDPAYHMSGRSLAVWFDIIVHSQKASPTRLLA